MNVREQIEPIFDNVERVIVGKRDVVELALVALLAEGHLLIEDVPGIGKTTLAKAIARSIGCSFGRIQFTPDLLPSDVTGISYFNQKTQEFEFRPGPLQSQVVLADEINRATPRTQSALLEAMQERQITVDGQTRTLPRPFIVLATQNPIELEGTFPLPEAQVDRFLMRIRLGYPTEAQENDILTRYREEDPMDGLRPLVLATDIIAMQHEARHVRMEASVQQYLVQVVRATREHPSVSLGVSPRGSLALYRAAQALAALQGRDYALPDTVKALVPHVLTHRILIHPQARLRGRSPQEVLDEIVSQVQVPVEH